jgi:hypothetical protein
MLLLGLHSFHNTAMPCAKPKSVEHTTSWDHIPIASAPDVKGSDVSFKKFCITT